MICPKCGGKTYVTNSFEKKEFVARYRKCKVCGNSFKTREMKDSDWVYKEIVKKIKQDLEKINI